MRPGVRWKRRLVRQGPVTALAVAAVLVAAACSDDSADTATPPSSATTSVSPATPEPAAPARPQLSAPAAAPEPAEPTTDPYAGSPLIDHTEWTDDPDGRRLHVYPTPAGRDDQFPAAQDRAWAEILAAAPDADSPGMYDQFVCHWVWARMVAPNKPSWNIEPWRPAVGYQATVAAMCNPGGPDPAGN
ncbi:hypothetical protein NONO_c40620 [Nocardia nova SH22a]|uniref:DUF2599 domain-containing protein n=1 Tax=Nocardia nova SH22a TaxID=1415166 RepID=W5TNP8_9NOCA|nr:DUF2599 domain-containing protein [Nocardia nova]AHH18846.1 hypothetical protein NONO_c40620 [Nocardia nova SH22a]